MIRILESLSPEDLKILREFCGTDVFGCRALAPLEAYGTAYPFLSAWVQREGDMPISLITKSYGAVTLYAPGPDTEQQRELCTFLEVIGYDSLMTEAYSWIRQRAGDETGIVMRHTGPSKDILLPDETEYCRDDRFRDLYSVLQQSMPEETPQDYSAWLVDLSHRIRHDAADSVLLRKGKESVATASILARTEDAVYIGAVGTIPEEQGNGYASAAVTDLMTRYPDRPAYLFCRPSLVSFYERLGFESYTKYYTTSHRLDPDPAVAD